MARSHKTLLARADKLARRLSEKDDRHDRIIQERWDSFLELPDKWKIETMRRHLIVLSMLSPGEPPEMFSDLRASIASQIEQMEAWITAGKPLSELFEGDKDA